MMVQDNSIFIKVEIKHNQSYVSKYFFILSISMLNSSVTRLTISHRNIFNLRNSFPMVLSSRQKIVLIDPLYFNSPLNTNFNLNLSNFSYKQTQLTMSDPKSLERSHPTNSLKIFGKLLITVEILIIIFYAIYVRVKTQPSNDKLINQRYPVFQDVNVMMLIGFGFLMTFIKTHALSALSYTFFINAIVIQLYILINPFWERIIKGNPNNEHYIDLEQLLITRGSYCVAAVLISFGGVIGKVGPKELLLMGIIEVVGYGFNEVFVSSTIGALDVGGSMLIHSFGAYFGLTVSWILSSKITPTTRAGSNYNSYIFGLIGTLFLWMFWPSFNFGVGAENFYDQNQIFTNTLLSLTGSCLSTFAVSSLFGHGLVMDDILNATLAGGVAIGASSGVLYQPSIALIIGFAAGVISTLGFHFLTPKLESLIGLYDTCGINNLHGIPGVFGGLVSAVVIAGYNLGYNNENAGQYGPSGLFSIINSNNHTFGRSTPNDGAFLHQAWLQVLGTATSVAVAIVFGVIAGQLISTFYSERKENFYEDREYFDQVLFEENSDEMKLN